MLGRIDRMPGKGPAGAITKDREHHHASSDPAKHSETVNRPHRAKYTVHRDAIPLRQVCPDPAFPTLPRPAPRGASFAIFDYYYFGDEPYVAASRRGIGEGRRDTR
jgi:hypothetical protein